MTATNEDDYDLSDYIKEVEQHIKQGRLRLEDAYENVEINSENEGIEPLNRPPHQLLIEDACELITESSGRDSRGVILRGIGTEILLNGIYMKMDTDGYLAHFEGSGGKSSDYSKLKQVLVEDLAQKLNNDAKRRVVLVMDIIRKQRNNRVHLAFHKYNHAAFEPTALRTLCFLIEHYSEESLDSVDVIRSRIQELEKANTGRSFPRVDFELNE